MDDIFRPTHSLACSPGLGSLSPSKARVVGAETSCLTPGLRLSRANGQSTPSVDSISIVGTGGKVFSSAGMETEVKGHSDREIMYRIIHLREDHMNNIYGTHNLSQ